MTQGYAAQGVAVHWLNEVLPADTAFNLVKLDAYRIGDSHPAPLVTIVAGPSPEAKEIGAQKKDLAQRHVLRLEFWRQLLERANELTSLHARISPGKDYRISAGAGKSGLAFNYVVPKDDARVELYIDTGEAEVNKSIFDQLEADRDRIDKTFGAALDWQRLEERRASRICHLVQIGGLEDEDRWPEIHEAMIDAMIRLEKALKPRIRQLRT